MLHRDFFGGLERETGETFQTKGEASVAGDPLPLREPPSHPQNAFTPLPREDFPPTCSHALPSDAQRKPLHSASFLNSPREQNYSCVCVPESLGHPPDPGLQLPTRLSALGVRVSAQCIPATPGPSLG